MTISVWWLIPPILLVEVWCFSLGYKKGKKAAFDLIEQHLHRGLDPWMALEYERDVMAGKVPRG